MQDMMLFDTGVDYACEKCKAYKSCNTQFTYKGKGKSKILLVVDSPTENEDMKGELLTGESGDHFFDILADIGYKRSDFWITSAIKCHQKKVSERSIKQCRQKLVKEIKDLKPKGVILLGNDAINCLIGSEVDRASALSLSGHTIPYLDTFVVPMISPKFLKRNEFDQNLTSYYKRTFKQVCSYIRKTDLPEIENPYDNVIPLTEFGQVEKMFKRIFKNTEDHHYAFDYESTGLNPRTGKHKITTMSICDGKKSYSFPVEYQEYWDKSDLKQIKKWIRKFLNTKEIFKIAHGSNFEYLWSRYKLKADDVFIHWCTRTMQHLVDTRSGTTGLKTQCFLRWGIYGFEDDAGKFIKAKKDSVFNNMDKMPLPKQLMYCGCDSWLTHKLFREQQEELSYNPSGSKFFNEGMMALAEVSYNGFASDMEWYEKQQRILKKKVAGIRNDIYQNKDVIRYMKKVDPEFTFTSNDDLRDFFVDYLEVKIDKKTASGKISVDEEALTKIDHPVADKILELRKLLKIKDTYIKNFIEASFDGRIHPDYTLHIARSLRSSSKNPNFQNIPKRNDYAKKVIRKGIKPSKGRYLAEVDFSGIEVSTSVLYHKDPTFLNYLVSDTADMHRDNAADIWKAGGDDISDKVRFYAKNCWTFPQFYGDYYASCAIALWENRKEKLNSGLTCEEHLRKKGIKSFKAFVDHLEGCERILWHERFPVYTKWKKDINKRYQEDGIIETYFGFRFSGYLDKKQTANYPIQGTAFHIMLWCLIRLLKISKKEGWKSKIIGQIHDSMIWDIEPSEREHVLKTIKRVCEGVVVKKFDWITTQFRVDMEISEIDGNFGELEKIKLAA